MDSAFGIDHGEVEKGIGDVARTARLVGRANKQSFKLTRLHHKKAMGEAGYSTGLKGFKEGVSAGIRGQGRTYNAGAKKAAAVGRTRAQRDVGIAQRRRGPATASESFGEAMQIGSARMSRSLSNIDTRLKLR
jgi:hypothetical protein